MKSDIRSLELSQVEMISENMRTYINARCKDLLEVYVGNYSIGKFLLFIKRRFSTQLDIL